MAGEQAFAPSTASLPWEPDRPLTIHDAAAVIHALFPAIEVEGLKHLGSGWEFDAFVTTDGWVFRFHSLQETTARNAGVVERELDDVGGNEWLERGFAAASELRGLDPIVDQAVSWMRQISLPFARFDGKLRVIHQDLSPEHVIVMAHAQHGNVAMHIEWVRNAFAPRVRS